jgi:hypothetical protein
MMSNRRRGTVQPDPARQMLPFDDATDWAGNAPACSAPVTQ